MAFQSTIRPAYSRAEYISDAIVHFSGLVLVLGAVPVLIVLTAVWHGGPAAGTSVSIYGAALILMILASALYNLFPQPERAWLLKRLDHSAIYLKIAGTYTAFVLVSGQGHGLVAALWVAAATGVTLKLIAPDRLRWAGLGLYLLMGWAGVLAGGALLGALSTPVLVLMAVGGGLYTAGVGFYLWERLPFHNTIWHVFVLAASLVFYAAVLVAVLG